MPLFGNHGVTHPTQERRLPGSLDVGKEQKASTTPEFVAQALDGSGLIEIDNIRVEKPGELLLMENQGFCCKKSEGSTSEWF